MIAKPIRLVFDAMQQAGVDCLLMGGQACVLYGAAEFSKDVDFVVLADSENLDRLRNAMEILDAEVIAVPPFEASHLEAGLAVHFRCRIPGAGGLRVDVMTKMRGVAPFSKLWERRVTLQDHEGDPIHLLGVRDLVAAKKTQRDKDWPMIQRLMEVSYLSGGDNPAAKDVEFWLSELRTPELLIDLATRFPDQVSTQAESRPLLRSAIDGNRESLERGLVEEMLDEKARDRAYWEPLKKRLAELRQNRRA